MTTDTRINSSITAHNILSPPKTQASVTTRRHITDEVHNASRAPSEASAASFARHPTEDACVDNHKTAHNI